MERMVPALPMSGRVAFKVWMHSFQRLRDHEHGSVLRSKVFLNRVFETGLCNLQGLLNLVQQVQDNFDTSGDTIWKSRRAWRVPYSTLLPMSGSPASNGRKGRF